MKTESAVQDQLLAAVMSTLGRNGGKSKSPKKLAAMRRNIKKAWAARRKNGSKKLAA